MTEDKKLPSIFKMLSNFAKASIDYVSAGMPSVTPEQYEKRIKECHSCPHLKEDTKQCGLCGCYVENKASWRTSTCPDSPSRWEKIIVGEDGKKVNIKRG
jgi:hypothetical protein